MTDIARIDLLAPPFLAAGPAPAGGRVRTAVAAEPARLLTAGLPARTATAAEPARTAAASA